LALALKIIIRVRIFWKWFIFFEGNLNKAHIQHLEASLLKLSKAARRAKLINANEPNFPELSIAEKAKADRFLFEMLDIFLLVGLDAFKKRKPPENLLSLNIHRIQSKGYEEQDKFVVLKGSRAFPSPRPGVPDSIYRKRIELGNKGIWVPVVKELNKEGIMITEVDHYEFVQDYPFNSAAEAAGVILGRRASKSAWKDGNGTALGKIQDKRIEDINAKS